MDNKYLNKEWWMNWLEKLFPENYGTPEPNWNISAGALNWKYWKFHWYKKNEFILGINYTHRYSPKITVRVQNRPDLIYEGTFNLKEAENEATFIEALSNCDLMPLCVNVAWAKPFIEYYFKKALNSSSGMSNVSAFAHTLKDNCDG